MLDSQRYRDHAAHCLLAAKKSSEPYCRRLHLTLAASWIELANQDEVASKLLVNWGEVDSVAEN